MPEQAIYERQNLIEDLEIPEVATVVGCGGTGFWTAVFLAMSGVEELILIDPDIVEVSNLNRLLLGESYVGKKKTEALKNLILSIRGQVRIEIQDMRIEKPLDCQVLRGTVFCCTDNLKSQQIICAYCKKNELSYQRIGYDGNGRTARLLSTLILYKTGYDFKRLFTISEYYDKDRPAYYQAIQTVRKNNMDMTTWLEYFVDGLRSQMTEIQAKGEQLIKQDSQLQKIKKIGLNKRQEKAVKHLIIKGTLSVNEYQSVASCIRRTAQRDLEELVEKKVIKIVAKSTTDPTKHYVLL
jgi:molybdopterin/thiamine biosynthesis adenylyltransferase